MVQELKDIKIEYLKEEPIKISPVGSGDSIYCEKILDNSFFFNKNYVYPCVVQYDGILKLVFFLSRPNEYYDKGYKIYRLKRPNSTATYIPIPKHLNLLLLMGGEISYCKFLRSYVLICITSVDRCVRTYINTLVEQSIRCNG